MTHFSTNIRPYVERELALANSCSLEGKHKLAFSHLENAHVLGQNSTRLHVVAHIRMLQWAIYQKNFKEVLGQLFRIIGATTKTVFGLVPTGNTGGSNVSPFKVMDLSPEHNEIISRAKKNT